MMVKTVNVSQIKPHNNTQINVSRAVSEAVPRAVHAYIQTESYEII